MANVNLKNEKRKEKLFLVLLVITVVLLVHNIFLTFSLNVDFGPTRKLDLVFEISEQDSIEQIEIIIGNLLIADFLIESKLIRKKNNPSNYVYLTRVELGGKEKEDFIEKFMESLKINNLDLFHLENLEHSLNNYNANYLMKIK